MGISFVSSETYMMHLLQYTITYHSSHIYVCLTVALCDCFHGKEQHQLGQRERSFKEVLFFRLCEQIWLATHRWLSCSQLCSRALRLGWETMKRYPRTIPGPFTISLLGNESQKDPLQGKLRLHQRITKCILETGIYNCSQMITLYIFLQMLRVF